MAKNAIRIANISARGAQVMGDPAQFDSALSPKGQQQARALGNADAATAAAAGKYVAPTACAALRRQSRVRRSAPALP